MRTIILSFLSLILCITSVFSQDQRTRAFHFSLISPLGSNGLSSHLTTNKVSINLIGGYSYGNTGFELGSLYNVNTHLTRGFQLSGFLNYSGNADRAVQISGFCNIVSKGTTPFQLSGLFNVSDNVTGLQFSSIVNVAKRVRGVQFGLINYADSSDGVSFGLINIVKNGGKQEFELSFSELLNTAISFRLGNDNFYTIFSGGLNYLRQPLEYGIGLGFGTHISWKKGWGNQIEVMGYSLTEQGKFTNCLNMLTQLKFTFSKQFFKRLKIFAGPTFNLVISDYKNPATGALGSSLPVWSHWRKDSENLSLNGWIGLVIGLRF